MRSTITLVLLVATSLGGDAMTQAATQRRRSAQSMPGTGGGSSARCTRASTTVVRTVGRERAEQSGGDRAGSGARYVRHRRCHQFSKFEREIEFIRVEREFVFIMGLEILVPVTDAPGRPRRRTHYQATLYEHLER